VYCDTLKYDLEKVKKSIESDTIRIQDVNLLKAIGSTSHDLNIRYGKAMNQCDSDWEYYEDSNFQLVVDLYAKGRDFFVTLLDVGNAGVRLKDYAGEHSIVTNEINVGGNIVSSQLLQGNTNIGQKISIENGVNYSEIIKYLQQIQAKYNEPEFNNSFASDAEPFRQKLNQTINDLEKKSDKSIIKTSIEFLKEAAHKAAVSSMSTEIIKIITHISASFE
jgi:hypothetical protein